MIGRIFTSQFSFLVMVNVACIVTIVSYYLIIRKLYFGIFGPEYFNVIGLLSIFMGNIFSAFILRSVSRREINIGIFTQIFVAFLVMPASYAALYVESFGFERFLILLLVYIFFYTLWYNSSKIQVAKKINISFISRGKFLIYLLALILITLSILYYTSSGDGGFDLASVYERRLAARTYYQSYEFLRYFPGTLGYGLGGMAVYLLAVSGRFSISLFFIIVLSLFLYWLIGMKSQIFFLILTFGLGALYRRGKTGIFVYLIVLSLISVGFFGLLEFLVADQYTILDKVLRRVYVSPAFNVTLYLELIFESGTWDVLIGENNLVSVGLHIGEHYLNVPDANVSTNGYISSFTDNGVIGILYHGAIMVAVVYVIFGRLFVSDPCISVYLTWMVAYLSIEQSWTTMLLSSGVAISLLFSFAAAPFRIRKMYK